MMSLTTTALRARLGDAIARVAYGKERVRITRRGKTIAVVVPAEDYEYWTGVEAKEDAEDIAAGDAAIKDYEKTGKSYSHEQIKKELGIK
jgi:prevent-host-death family protein